jgi:Ca2+-binding RTX toxin-like protein
VDVETASVPGNNTCATPTGFVPTVAGTYQWVAAFTSSNPSTSNASTATGTTPEIAVGSGVTVVGTELYLVGGKTSNDQVSIKPLGTSKTSGTGIQINASLNGQTDRASYTQAFTTIVVVGFGGSDHITSAATLTIPAVIVLANGNNSLTVGCGSDLVRAGNGNNTISLGQGSDTVAVGNGNNVVVGGSGNDKIGAGNGNNLLIGGLGHDTLQAGKGSNILVDGSVNDSMSVLDQVLSKWAQEGNSAANVAAIRSQLGAVTYNTQSANTLEAGSGLDWFWASYAKDKLNNKSTDLLR